VFEDDSYGSSHRSSDVRNEQGSVDFPANRLVTELDSKRVAKFVRSDRIDQIQRMVLFVHKMFQRPAFYGGPSRRENYRVIFRFKLQLLLGCSPFEVAGRRGCRCGRFLGLARRRGGIGLILNLGLGCGRFLWRRKILYEYSARRKYDRK